MLRSQPFDDAALSYAAPEDGRLKQAVIRTVERLSGQKRAERIYREVKRGLGPDSNVWAEAVRGLNVRVNYDAARLAAVPRTGPLVVVANHPFGVVDGLVALPPGLAGARRVQGRGDEHAVPRARGARLRAADQFRRDRRRPRPPAPAHAARRGRCSRPAAA